MRGELVRNLYRNYSSLFHVFYFNEMCAHMPHLFLTFWSIPNMSGKGRIDADLLSQQCGSKLENFITRVVQFGLFISTRREKKVTELFKPETSLHQTQY